MHSRGDNNPNNVSVTRKKGEIYMSSKITYMVRPISIHTELLQTEISHPKRCSQRKSLCESPTPVTDDPIKP